jgi:histidinol phosphatase-like enzyme (inositol monophosphatase family)
LKTTRTPSFGALLACAHDLANASGKVIRPQFRKAIAVDDKGGSAGFDPVTAADRAAERAIAKHLASAFPEHGMLGEEYGSRRPDARFRWVVDPIDGTRAFITGMPTWGTLIGLMDGDQAVLGMMDQPFTGERFWSTRAGAHARDADGKTRHLKTRACASIGTAVFSSTHPDLFATAKEQRVLDAIKSRVRLTRYGGDCYGYCMLAAGHIDLIVEPGLKPYDIVALIPIIERAGGCITTWDGSPATNGGNIVAAGDPALHEAVLRLIRNA